MGKRNIRILRTAFDGKPTIRGCAIMANDYRLIRTVLEEQDIYRYIDSSKVNFFNERWLTYEYDTELKRGIIRTVAGDFVRYEPETIYIVKTDDALYPYAAASHDFDTIGKARSIEDIRKYFRKEVRKGEKSLVKFLKLTYKVEGDESVRILFSDS